MAEYRLRPVKVEAFRLPPKGDYRLADFHLWAGRNRFTNYYSDRDEDMVILAAGFEQRAEPGDWIVRLPGGLFCACKPGTFELLFEATSS